MHEPDNIVLIHCGGCDKETNQEFKNGGMHLIDRIKKVFLVSEIFYCECGTFNYREYKKNGDTDETWDFDYVHVFKSPSWAKQHFPNTPDWIFTRYTTLIDSLNNAEYEKYGDKLKQLVESIIIELTVRFKLNNNPDKDYRRPQQKVTDLVKVDAFPQSVADGLILIHILIKQLTEGHFGKFINGMERYNFLKNDIRKEVDRKMLSGVKILENTIFLSFEIELFSKILQEEHEPKNNEIEN